MKIFNSKNKRVEHLMKLSKERVSLDPIIEAIEAGTFTPPSHLSTTALTNKILEHLHGNSFRKFNASEKDRKLWAELKVERNALVSIILSKIVSNDIASLRRRKGDSLSPPLRPHLLRKALIAALEKTFHSNAVYNYLPQSKSVRLNRQKTDASSPYRFSVIVEYGAQSGNWECMSRNHSVEFITRGINTAMETFESFFLVLPEILEKNGITATRTAIKMAAESSYRTILQLASYHLEHGPAFIGELRGDHPLSKKVRSKLSFNPKYFDFDPSTLRLTIPLSVLAHLRLSILNNSITDPYITSIKTHSPTTGCPVRYAPELLREFFESFLHDFTS
jgi:hypothetical protein